MLASLAKQEAQLLEPISKYFRGHYEKRGREDRLREECQLEGSVVTLQKRPPAPTFNVRRAGPRPGTRYTQNSLTPSEQRSAIV